MRPNPSDAETFQEHAGFLRRLARGLLDDASQAEDVVQETWMTAKRRPPTRDTNLRTWLATVARHLAFRSRRSDQRRRRREKGASRRESLPSSVELAARMELQRKVLDAVDRLKEPFRSTLIYRYFDDLTPTEIAARSDVPVKTIKSRLYRGLQALRLRLDNEHGGNRRAWSVLLIPMLPMRPASAAAVGAVTVSGGATMKKLIGVLTLFFLAATVAVWHTATTREGGEPHRSPPSRRESTLPAERGEPDPDSAATEHRLAVLHNDDDIPAFTFAGRVVDGRGTGVGDAQVNLFYWAAPAAGGTSFNANILRGQYEQHEAPSTRTTGGGYFRIDRPYSSRSYLVVRADGFAPVVSKVQEPGSFILITLEKRAPLSVAVVDDRSRPVPEATVRLVTASGRSTIRCVLAVDITDSAGMASIPIPSDEALRLEVAPKEPALGFVESGVEAGRDEVQIVVPSIEPTTRRVVDKRSGMPVKNAYVMICMRGAGRPPIERRRFLADRDGWVRFPSGPANFPVLASAPGYEVVIVGVAEEVKIAQAMRVEGVLLDPQDRPVSSAPVLVAIPPSGLFMRAHSALPIVAAWTNPQGRFALDLKMAPTGLQDGGFRSLIALHSEMAPAIIDAISFAPGRVVSVELRFPMPATLTVEIFDPEGKPMPRQWVTLRRKIPTGSANPQPARGQGVDLVALRPPHSLVTDTRGRVEATHLPPGDYDIRTQNTTAEVTLTEGERAVLRLTKGAGARISGRVLDASGKPVPRIWVGVHGPSSSARTVTDRSGRFRFDDLKPGLHRVGVSVMDGGRMYTYELPAAPGDDVELRLPSGPAKLHVQVKAPADVSVQYFLYTVTGGREPRPPHWATLGPDRETPGFTPGHGIIVVRAKGHGWNAVLFDVAAQRTSTVRVQLLVSGKVEGRVAEPVADPMNRVRLVRQDGWTWSGETAVLWKSMLRRLDLSSPVAADGSFAIEDVPPGLYRAIYGSWSAEIASSTVEVRSGEIAKTALTPPGR